MEVGRWNQVLPFLVIVFIPGRWLAQAPAIFAAIVPRGHDSRDPGMVALVEVGVPEKMCFNAVGGWIFGTPETARKPPVDAGFVVGMETP